MKRIFRKALELLNTPIQDQIPIVGQFRAVFIWIDKTKQEVQIERLSRFQVRVMNKTNRAMKFNFSEAVKLSLRAISRIFNINLRSVFIISYSLICRSHLQYFEQFPCFFTLYIIASSLLNLRLFSFKSKRCAFD